MTAHRETACEVAKPLPAVVEDRSRLSAAAKQQLKELMRRAPGCFLMQLVLAWTAIFATVIAAGYFQNVWFAVIAILFIATRQNVLALLMHEQVHHSAFRSKWGDLLCDLAIAYPLLVTVAGYRRVHLAHHRYFLTDRDPDYLRKQGTSWTFPQRARQLIKTLLTDLMGLNVLQLLKSKNKQTQSPEAKRASAPTWVRPVYYGTLLGVVIATDTWYLLLIYWLVPLLTVMQVIVRLAAVCEHKYDLVNPTVVQATPLIQQRWWEAILLPSLNFHTFHIYHHWYPAVPCSKLPRVHEIFRREGLVHEEHVFRSYAQYLTQLVK